MLRKGDRIGEWIVDETLGEGGMGAVYRVHSALTERLLAALKVMKPTIAEDARRRFVREAEALSALRHPAIVRVMGFSEDSRRGLLYLVMELATGETLKDRLARGPMSLPEALQTFVPLASALDHAHAANIFHRDLKPANVVLCDDGTPRLVDFGIAAGAAGDTLTSSGHMGTLSYLPPEIFRGATADPRSIDVYGFGLLLHESLTGQRLYPVEPNLTPAVAAAQVGVRKLQQAALDPGDRFPERIREMIMAATSPDPVARPDMHGILEALQSLTDRRSAPVKTTGERHRLPPPPVAAPAEHTTRVPDPPKPAVGGPWTNSRGAVLTAAGIFALLLVLTLAMLARRKGGDPPEEVAPSPSADSSAARGVPPAPATPSSPVAAPSPLRPVRSPSAAASLAPLPSPLPSPRPSLVPVLPEATPLPLPSPSPRPDFVVTPEVEAPEDTEPPDEPVESPSPRAGQVDGRWSLTNRIVITDHEPFRGLQLGYALTLRQSGNRVTGRGVKISENGVRVPDAQRTPISVSGVIEDGTLVLTFTEQGTGRASGGTFRWRLSNDGAALTGSFSSDVANANGRSVARRVP